MNNIPLDFFATANTGKGFISYYRETYSNLRHLYIIKGGPGTGKSSLMKTVADEAISQGMQIERFRCSSDPSSLDGLIIKDLSIAITDGTSPHSIDPEYPGAYDEIINLGEYWNRDILTPHFDEIKQLCDKKNMHYKLAYSYLSCALNISRTVDSITKNAVRFDKLEAFGDRFIKKNKVSSGIPSVRLTAGITTDGICRLDGYTSTAEKTYIIEDRYNIAHHILGTLAQKLNYKSTVVSYEALDPDKINMLYLPSSGLLMRISGDSNDRICTKRFIDLSEYNRIKPEIKKCHALKDEIITLALLHMNKVKKYHMQLEDIYIKAMDFDKKEEAQSKLIKEIFS